MYVIGCHPNIAQHKLVLLPCHNVTKPHAYVLYLVSKAFEAQVRLYGALSKPLIVFNFGVYDGENIPINDWM